MIVDNSTISTILQHHHCHSIESINEPTAINDIVLTQYDSAGAALFIIVVLLWFSLGTVCMLGMQIPAHAETVEDCARRRAKLFILTLKDQTQKKQILEELADKQKRDKLWKIYLGKTDTYKDELKHAEILRIKNIEKQLAVINRNRMIMNDIILTPVQKNIIRRTSSESRSTFISNLSAVENQSHHHHHRRSSLDQQVIERWKSIVDQNQTLEQCSSTNKRVHPHPHFRRFFKNSSKQSKEKHTSIINSPSNHEHLDITDDEQCHLLPIHKIIDNHSRTLNRKSNELLNPYITYFHLPINENVNSNIQNLPLVTMKSDHHIIQMNDDEYQC